MTRQRRSLCWKKNCASKSRASPPAKYTFVPVVESIEEIARAELDEEQVEVTRVHVGREVTTAPEVRTEGDVVIVPVLEEVLVVEKRLVLKEELHIRRHVSKEVFEVPITLRKQRAVVERVAMPATPTPKNEEYDR